MNTKKLVALATITMLVSAPMLARKSRIGNTTKQTKASQKGNDNNEITGKKTKKEGYLAKAKSWFNDRSTAVKVGLGATALVGGFLLGDKALQMAGIQETTLRSKAWNYITETKAYDWLATTWIATNLSKMKDKVANCFSSEKVAELDENLIVQ